MCMQVSLLHARGVFHMALSFDNTLVLLLDWATLETARPEQIDMCIITDMKSAKLAGAMDREASVEIGSKNHHCVAPEITRMPRVR